MTEEIEMTKDEALEKLLTLHDVKVHYNATTSFKGGEPKDRLVTYRVTQYTLREFMADVASGANMVNVVCLRRNPLTGDWVEAFETICLANVCSIEWPAAAATQMHAAMSQAIEEMVDDAFDNCEAAEEEE